MSGSAGGAAKPRNTPETRRGRCPQITRINTNKGVLFEKISADSWVKNGFNEKMEKSERCAKNLANQGVSRLDPDVGGQTTPDGAKSVLADGSRNPIA